MSNVLCEVIGCKRPAVWIRVVDLDFLQEDFLCDPCWVALCKEKPEQANCYAPYDDELATMKHLARPCDSRLPATGNVSQSTPVR